MAEKIIRIWNGCMVIAMISVDTDGGTSLITRTGGAGNSTNADVEIDPFAGVIVTHEADVSPIAYREERD
jgi:hypothetical protein